MKALSVKIPWSWLIVNGLKDIENREWATNFRGRVYIHAGKQQDYDAYQGDSVHRFLEPYIWNQLPSDALLAWANLPISQYLGAIVGEVDIVDCVTEHESHWFQGTYGFVLENPVAYETPIPCRGKLGFFEPDLHPKAVNGR